MKTDQQPLFPPKKLKSALATPFAPLRSLAAGLLTALVLHYILYRIGIPGTPFIYVSF